MQHALLCYVCTMYNEQSSRSHELMLAVGSATGLGARPLCLHQLISPGLSRSPQCWLLILGRKKNPETEVFCFLLPGASRLLFRRDLARVASNDASMGVVDRWTHSQSIWATFKLGLVDPSLVALVPVAGD